MKITKPSVGFWLMLVGFVFSIVAFVLYFTAYAAFKYESNLWVIALSVIGLWGLACLLVNGLLAGNKPFFMDIFYIIAVFCLVLAMILFLSDCLSPIGIYFTVHNMGDVEANAAGVPRCIAGVAFYAVASLLVIVSGFIGLMSRKGETKAGAETDAEGGEKA